MPDRTWFEQASGSEAQRARAARQMQPLAAAIAADPVKVKDRLYWYSIACWSIGFLMGLGLLGFIWAVLA